jgi:hypothetical protein
VVEFSRSIADRSIAVNFLQFKVSKTRFDRWPPEKIDQANTAQELLNQRIHAALAMARGAKVVPPEQKESPGQIGGPKPSATQPTHTRLQVVPHRDT